MKNNSYRTTTVLRYIDSTISKFISEDSDINTIIEKLDWKISKFEKVLSNCKENEVRYKYVLTHNKVCLKRIDDLTYAKKLMNSYEEYSNYSISKIFKLIQFRDKFGDKFVVNLD